jgi:hypothetical protein
MKEIPFVPQAEDRRRRMDDRGRMKMAILSVFSVSSVAKFLFNVRFLLNKWAEFGIIQMRLGGNPAWSGKHAETRKFHGTAVPVKFGR